MNKRLIVLATLFCAFIPIPVNAREVYTFETWDHLSCVFTEFENEEYRVHEENRSFYYGRVQCDWELGSINGPAYFEVYRSGVMKVSILVGEHHITYSGLGGGRMMPTRD